MACWRSCGSCSPAAAQLGLHRLRLDGELTEIRAADLRFTLEESRDLLDAAGVRLSEEALGPLHERTEGWAAGLRLAALCWPGTRTRTCSPRASPAASERWPSTSWPKSWDASRSRSRGC